MNRLGVLCLVSMASFGSATAARAQSPSITPHAAQPFELLVGVISPKDGSRQVGFAHQDTIEFAFANTDGTVGPANLRLDYRSDNGVPATAADEGKVLAAEGAIAILGPVDSGSTAAVLAEHLDLPVISALSTATSLTMPQRDRWFFRMTLSDLNRMRAYVTTLRKDSLISEPSMILYDSTSAYGTGLNENMREALGMPNIVSLPWNDPRVGSLASSGSPPAMLYVLGSGAEAARLARQIDLDLQTHGARAGTTRYAFVGDEAELRSLAPPGSVTIGEPTLVDEAGSDIASLRRAYARTDRKAETFQVTTYEAYQVLNAALSMLVAKHPRPGELASRPIQELRTELRDILENTRSFSSLEAWRTIRFQGGDVDGAPPVPVYVAESTLKVIDVLGAKPFVEIDAPEQAGYLEGSVTITARAHQGARLDALTIKRDGRRGREDVEPTVALDGDVAKLTFFPLIPGTYTVHTGLPTKPATVSVEVRIGWAYPLAGLGALIGSLLFVLSMRRRAGDSAAVPTDREFPWGRIALGLLTGVALAALDLYRSLVPGGAALPTLADTKTLAAFWDGVAGGWLGPGLIVVLVPRLFPYPVSSSGETKGPAGPSTTATAPPGPPAGAAA